MSYWTEVEKKRELADRILLIAIFVPFIAACGLSWMKYHGVIDCSWVTATAPLSAGCGMWAQFYFFIHVLPFFKCPHNQDERKKDPPTLTMKWMFRVIQFIVAMTMILVISQQIERQTLSSDPIYIAGIFVGVIIWLQILIRYQYTIGSVAKRLLGLDTVESAKKMS